MSKYKVGDKVKVREDLIENKCYGSQTFVDKMMKLKGKEVTIKSTYDYDNIDEYRIVESGYTWTNEMFEPVNENKEQPKYVKCIDNRDMKGTLEIGKIYKVKSKRECFNTDRYSLVGFDSFVFYTTRFEPVSNPQTKSTKSIIKIRQVGDTTYATYGKSSGKAIRNSSIDEYNKETGILISVLRALNTSEEKVKSIIDVLFNENKEEVVDTDREFQVGDRVIGVGSTKVGYDNKTIKGLTGKVSDLNLNHYIGIEFDEYINGHSLSGKCKDKHCWCVSKDEIRLISKDEEVKQLQEENEALRNELKDVKTAIKSMCLKVGDKIV